MIQIVPLRRASFEFNRPDEPARRFLFAIIHIYAIIHVSDSPTEAQGQEKSGANSQIRTENRMSRPGRLDSAHAEG
ncbi:hypothetical protein [Rhodoblastus sp.]|uniref:hypothetical protein n=1 Tax=Rhodoblastus sp. TaxID=1962975 RepID=UPI003F97C313